MVRNVTGVELAGSTGQPPVMSIALDGCEAPLLVCDDAGNVLGATAPGLALMARLRVELDPLPAPLARALWRDLVALELGQAIHWHADTDRMYPDATVSCSRHRLGDDWLLILREWSADQAEAAQQPQAQTRRFERLDRIVAAAAHDLRTPLSSIIFGVDVLARHQALLAHERTSEIIGDVRTASLRLRETVDCLLDYMSGGPAAALGASIEQVLLRVQSLLRPHLRTTSHEVQVRVERDARVAGNLLMLEQIFVSLVVQLLDSAQRPSKLLTTAWVDGRRAHVVLEREDLAAHVDSLAPDAGSFGREVNVGLDYAAARDAVHAIGGELRLVRWGDATSFHVYLPIHLAGAARARSVEEEP